MRFCGNPFPLFGPRPRRRPPPHRLRQQRAARRSHHHQRRGTRVLDPAIITGQPDGRVVGSLFEGLTRLDPKTADAVPAIAERWDLSPDGTVYTFHLRSNAVWSTGEPITAPDFVYSWQRVLDPNTASDYAGQLFYIKNGEDFNAGKIKDPTQLGVKALDARTLRVELDSPTPFFLDLCAFRTLAVVHRATIEKHGDRWMKARPLPLSGAYTLDFWRVNDKIRVRKNPRYWDAANVLNQVVDFIPCDQPNVALNLYETGAADIIWDKGLVPAELMDLLRQRSDCHNFDYLGTYFYRYNVNHKPFDDPRVRQALALAVDKQRIVERITKAGEKVATHLTPKGMSNYRPPEGLGYNPDAARKLLADAGFRRQKLSALPIPLQQQPRPRTDRHRIEGHVEEGTRHRNGTPPGRVEGLSHGTIEAQLPPQPLKLDR